MPFLTEPTDKELDSQERLGIERKASTQFIPQVEYAVPPKEKNSTTSTIGAWMRSDNMFVSIADAIDERDKKGEFNAAYNVFDQEDFTGIEPFMDDAAGINSHEQFVEWKSNIVERQQARAFLQNSSFIDNVIGGVISGTLDPTILIPIVGQARKVKTVKDLAKAATIGGAQVGAIESGRELALHSIQAERTVEESLANIAGATVLGSLFTAGAGGGKIAASKWFGSQHADEISRAFDQALDTSVEVGRAIDNGPIRAVGPEGGTTVAQVKIPEEKQWKHSSDIPDDRFWLEGRKLIETEDTAIRSLRAQKKNKTPEQIATIDTKIAEHVDRRNDLFDRYRGIARERFGVANLSDQQFAAYDKARNELIKSVETIQSLDQQLAREKVALEEGTTTRSAVTELEAKREKAVSKAQKAKAKIDSLTETNEQLTPEQVSELLAPEPTEHVSAGSAAVQFDYVPNLDDEKIVGGLLPEHIKFTPDARLLTSPSLSARLLVQKIAEHPYILKKHSKGIASEDAIETNIGARDHQAIDVVNHSKKQFKRYSKRVPANERTIKTFDEFDRAVGNAIESPDAHGIAEVRSAAKEYKRYFNRIQDELVDTGIFPEKTDLATSAGYLPHVYNARKITSEYNAFREDLANQIKSQLDADQQDYLKDIVEDIIANIMSYDKTGRGGSIVSDASASNHLKGRRLNFEQEFFNKWTIREASELITRYHSSVVPQIEWAKKLPDQSIGDVIKEIRKDYDNLFAAAKSERELEKLQKRLDADKRDIAFIAGRVLKMPNDREWLDVAPGTTAGRTIKVAKQATTMSMLGGVLPTSIAYDYARLITVNGLRGYIPLIKGVLTKLKHTDEIAKASKAEKDRLIGQVERATARRLKLIVDTPDEFVRGNIVERGSDMLTEKFFTATGLRHHNGFIKTIVAQEVEHKIVNVGIKLKNGGKLTDREKVDLSRIGIDEPTAKKIVDQYERYGTISDHSHIANWEAWDDVRMQNVWRSAINKAVDFTINTPKAGSRPIWISSAVGGLIMQFMAFSFAAWGQTSVSLYQKGSTKGYRTAAVVELATLLAAGAVTSELKYAIANRDAPDINTMTFWKEAVDRSGLLAVPFDIFNRVDAATKGTFSSALGAQRSFRFRNASSLQGVLGPWAGYADGAGTVFKGLLDPNEDFTRGDLHRARVMTPWNNLFYLRRGVDEIEDDLADALDLE